MGGGMWDGAFEAVWPAVVRREDFDQGCACVAAWHADRAVEAFGARRLRGAEGRFWRRCFLVALAQLATVRELLDEETDALAAGAAEYADEALAHRRAPAGGRRGYPAAAPAPGFGRRLADGLRRAVHDLRLRRLVSAPVPVRA